jgi:hypothetical protein
MITKPFQRVPYVPRIKGKGFCPNPIARYGITIEADSALDPDVQGTSLWEEFWLEQYDALKNGYVTGGVRIPPRYYQYLNFWPMATVGRGLHLPDPTDTDLELAELKEAVKGKYGLIIPKRRRCGMSEEAANDINWNFRMRDEEYRAAIIAGRQTYADTLMQKVSRGNIHMPPELLLNTLISNTETVICGYREKTDKGYTEKGSMNQVVAKTVFNNPNVLKGELLDDCYFEESGENDWLIATFNANKHCFMDGDKMVGTPYVYGTGGNIATGSAGFMEMWHEAEAFKLIRVRIYGDRKRKPYYLGARGTDGKVEHDIPNLIKLLKEGNYSPEQLLGCEDSEHAIKKIRIEQSELAKLKNKKSFWESKQNDPLTDNDVFMVVGGNQYDVDALTEATNRIGENPQMYKRYKLEWEVDKDGIPLLPRKVKATLIADDEDPEMWVEILEMPNLTIRNGYVQGLDGYDIDKSNTSLSLGSSVIMGNNNRSKVIDPGKIYAHIRCRPRRKEIFFEGCAMLSVMYNTEEACMVDARSPTVIDFYVNNGLSKYLAPRPVAFDSPNSEQNHAFGYKKSTYTVKPFISLNQTWVLDYSQHCWFPTVIKDFIDCDVSVVDDSDWDSHDAVGLANIQRVYGMRKAVVYNAEDKYDPMEVVNWAEIDGVYTPTNLDVVFPDENTDYSIFDENITGQYVIDSLTEQQNSLF